MATDLHKILILSDTQFPPCALIPPGFPYIIIVFCSDNRRNHSTGSRKPTLLEVVNVRNLMEAAVSCTKQRFKEWVEGQSCMNCLLPLDIFFLTNHPNCKSKKHRIEFKISRHFLEKGITGKRRCPVIFCQSSHKYLF